METFNWSDFAATAPVWVLVVAGCVLLMTEVYTTSRDRSLQGWMSAAFALVAGLIAYGQMDSDARDLFGGFARLDAFGTFTAMLVCGALALTSLVSHSYLKNLASAQEIYLSNNYAYAGTLTDLTDYRISDDVLVWINEATGTGWAATGTHAGLAGAQCGIFFGSAAAANCAPATTPGSVICN